MFEKAKKHVQDNKTVYITGAACLASGVLIGVAVTPKQIIIQGAGVAYKSPVLNAAHQTLVRRGHPGYVVRCLETGEVWASLSQAAKSAGVSRAVLKKLADEGAGFEIIGEMV